MNILVTGGAGFIGSNFIIYLINNYNDYIINLDKLTYAANLDYLSEIKNEDNYEFIKGDIRDRNLLEKILRKKIDYIVNFAAESHVDRSLNNAEKFIKTNVEGTQILLDMAKKYKVKKFLQISTDEVYGSLGKKGVFDEQSSLNPTSPYAASKASADLLVRSYYKSFNLNVNITRSTNNYGPNQFPEKLIPLFITKALKGEKLPLYGDGRNIRDWLYVKDHCRAIDLVMRNGKKGEIYNISANNELSNIEITKKIISILNKDEKLINFVEDRMGHDFRYALSSKKIKKELGWKNTTKFKEGLEKTINWYCNN
ncbi:MAG: dTDP-glucose 4,6-dehydratase [Bacillota bacterium]